LVSIGRVGERDRSSEDDNDDKEEGMIDGMRRTEAVNFVSCELLLEGVGGQGRDKF